MKTPINYHHIATAIDFYRGRGYELLDAPWVVSKESVEITRPPDRGSFGISGMGEEKFLVASGEQSFLQIRDELCPGRNYQCATPCFRDEPVYDEHHRLYFFKVELIHVLWKRDEPNPILHKMVRHATYLFKKLGVTCADKKPNEDGGVGIDIFAEGIEIGSYGIRHYKEFHWIYGTGLAEPRFSIAKSVCALSHEEYDEDE